MPEAGAFNSFRPFLHFAQDHVSAEFVEFSIKAKKLFDPLWFSVSALDDWVDSETIVDKLKKEAKDARCM